MARNTNRFDLETYIEQHPDEVRAAESIYETFYDREPEQDVAIEIEWPDDQIVLGRATAIGYRSDKWGDIGAYQDYIHHHDKPLPEVIIQRPGPQDKDPLHQELKNAPSVKNPIKEPKKFIFAQLGHGLDLEYIRDGIVEQIDWKETRSGRANKKLPILARTVDRTILVIQPVDGGYPVLIRSPKLKVTARGIEH